MKKALAVFGFLFAFIGVWKLFYYVMPDLIPEDALRSTMGAFISFIVVVVLAVYVDWEKL